VSFSTHPDQILSPVGAGYTASRFERYGHGHGGAISGGV
jgi:hypothetical protein